MQEPTQYFVRYHGASFNGSITKKDTVNTSDLNLDCRHVTLDAQLSFWIHRSIPMILAAPITLLGLYRLFWLVHLPSPVPRSPHGGAQACASETEQEHLAKEG